MVGTGVAFGWGDIEAHGGGDKGACDGGERGSCGCEGDGGDGTDGDIIPVSYTGPPMLPRDIIVTLR